MAMKKVCVSLALGAPLASAQFNFNSFLDQAKNEFDKQSNGLTDVVNSVKKSVPGACALFGCGTAYTETNSCQCDADCHAHDNCCVDYKDLCESEMANKFKESLGNAQATANKYAQKAQDVSGSLEVAKKQAAELAQKAQDAKEAGLAKAEEAKKRASDFAQQAQGLKDSAFAQADAAQKKAAELAQKAEDAKNQGFAQVDEAKKKAAELAQKAQDAKNEGLAKAEEAKKKAAEFAQQAQGLKSSAFAQADAAQKKAAELAQKAEDAKNQGFAQVDEAKKKAAELAQKAQDAKNEGLAKAEEAKKKAAEFAQQAQGLKSSAFAQADAAQKKVAELQQQAQEAKNRAFAQADVAKQKAAELQQQAQEAKNNAFAQADVANQKAVEFQKQAQEAKNSAFAQADAAKQKAAELQQQAQEAKNKALAQAEEAKKKAAEFAQQAQQAKNEGFAQATEATSRAASISQQVPSFAAQKAKAEELAANAREQASAAQAKLNEAMSTRGSMPAARAPSVGFSDALSGLSGQAKEQMEAVGSSIDAQRAKAEAAAADATAQATEGMQNVANVLRASSGSCLVYGCKTPFSIEHACHCTAECVAKGDCCSDYKDICENGDGGAMDKLMAAEDTAKKHVEELQQEAQAQMEHGGAQAKETAAALQNQAKDLLTNAGKQANTEIAGMEKEAKEQTQGLLDTATSLLGKKDELKQCTLKAVQGLDSTKACIAADMSKLCDCVADFNASTKACSAHVGGMKQLDTVPGAAACKEQAVKQLTGKFQLAMSNAEAFLGKESAVKAVEDAVAKMGGVPSKYVSAILKPLRDMGLTSRRLEDAAADVEADYTISVPDSSPLFNKLEETAQNIGASAATAKETLQQEIASTVGDGFTLSSVQEEAPVMGGEDAHQHRSVDHHGHLPWAAYVGIFLVAAAIVAGVIYLALGAGGSKKPQKKTKRSAKTSVAAPAAAAPAAIPLAPAQYAPVASYSFPAQHATVMHAVPTQAYQMPVYYQPTTTISSSPRSFVAAAPAAYVPTASYP
eukprot:TRINITY_DN561_c0_g1_i1.p1 TRINITY_DN561_c0_g1~~TRINITY_DN561_c0_g1_i1.p1  ORF type:complete len:1025 (-),score=365.17 TRINITY_DN561_c0_g1_i1:55-3129(-)